MRQYDKSKLRPAEMQAGAFRKYIWNGNYAMKCLIWRADVTLAS